MTTKRGCSLKRDGVLARLALVMAAAAGMMFAQRPLDFVVDASNDYWIQPDAVYEIANDHQNKLDIIYPHNATAPVPAVIYIHGGGWVFGTKEGAVLYTLPYLEMGWAAVNVEYRMASSAN